MLLSNTHHYASGRVNMRDIPPRTIKGHGKSKKEAHLDAAVQAIAYLSQCGVYQPTAAQPAMHVHVEPPPQTAASNKRGWDDFAGAFPCVHDHDHV